MIPFARPSLGEAEFNTARQVLQSGWITTGPKNLELEQALKDYIGGSVQVRLFNSCTSAMEATLLAYGIGPGDEVIVPAMSFVATANVVLRVGAKPVFVDVDLNSRNLDADRIAAALTKRSRAIIPVHFAGLPVDMEPIYRLAEKKGLLVLEDAAQAIGSQYGTERIGSRGNPVCFSFHPNKNMTTIEGGALACADSKIIRRIEKIRFHGIEKKGSVQVRAWGGKMNLPDVNAAIGLVQLARLDEFNRRRKQLAKLYFNQLPDHPALALPADHPGHSWHMFCIRLDWNQLGVSRQTMIQAFKQKGIQLGIHYPAIHLFSLYRPYAPDSGQCVHAEQIGEQTITLPLFPDLSIEQCQLISRTLTDWLEAHS